jgi:uncharacterized protein
LAKPSGPKCNLDCTYCFYLKKEELFPATSNFRMSAQVREAYVRQYIESQPGNEVTFAWQGGEPTLMGLGFFRDVVALQKKYCLEEKNKSKTCTNAFQTNGVLINDEWAAFFKEHDFLVGLSLDGPRHIHDANRVDQGGAPTFDSVMRAAAVLHKHQVRVNCLTCVCRANEAHGAEVYRFLRDEAKFEHLQFIPIVEPVVGTSVSIARPGQSQGVHDHLVMPWSVRSEGYGRFLNAVFDAWLEHDVGRVFVQTFEVTLNSVMGLPAPLCIHRKECGRAMAVEHDGTLYSCDHFVTPQHALGNILKDDLATLAQSPAQKKFGTDKSVLPRECRLCEYLPLCYGECPKNRLIDVGDKHAKLNYLCAGLKRYYAHVLPVLSHMAHDISRQR